MVRRLLIALIAAKAAGSSIVKIYNTDFCVEYKKDNSPFTLADKNSNEIISGYLSNSGLQIPILSEENKDIPYPKRRHWEYFWLIDPLDGTKEFVKRNGDFTVNIALIYKGRPVLGVVYAPVPNLFYFAAGGIGAYKAGNIEYVNTQCGKTQDRGALEKLLSGMGEDVLTEVINSSERLPFKSSNIRFTVAVSRSHMSPETEEYINKLKEVHGDVKVIQAGSSLKFCMVAEGSADIYPRLGPTMEWDTAAAQAIVEQSGGGVFDFNSNKPIRYNKENLLNPWFVVLQQPVI